MAVFPEHTSLTIFHNWHTDNGYSGVEECFDDNGGFKIEEWDSPLAYQKACGLNELWSMHWYPPKDPNDNKLLPVQQKSIYAPTFQDLMKVMITLTEGKLVELP